jgi:hypothetical protein
MEIHTSANHCRTEDRMSQDQLQKQLWKKYWELEGGTLSPESYEDESLQLCRDYLENTPGFGLQGLEPDTQIGLYPYRGANDAEMLDLFKGNYTAMTVEELNEVFLSLFRHLGYSEMGFYKPEERYLGLGKDHKTRQTKPYSIWDEGHHESWMLLMKETESFTPASLLRDILLVL